MNKKYIYSSIIILVLVISFSVYKYADSAENTEYITVELGNHITWDMAGHPPRDIDLGMKIKSVKVVNQPYDYYNFDIKAKGTSLNLHYSSIQSEKIIPREIFNYGTMPLLLYGGETIEIGINKKDVGKLKELAEKYPHTSLEDNIFKFNELRLELLDFWNGEHLEIPYPVASNDIKTFLVDVLQPMFEKAYRRNQDTYLQHYSNVIEDTENLLGQGSDIEKLQNLLTFIQDTQPIPEDIIKKGPYRDPDFLYRFGIDNLLRNNEGVCQNKAYYTKYVLDTMGLENELVTGYIYGEDSTEKIGHVLNAVKMKKSWKYSEEYATEFIKLHNYIPEEVIKEAISSNAKYLSDDWILIDTGFYSIDYPGVYFTFISTQEIDM